MPVRGLRVTVMGLGRFGGGAAVARWLARQGAAVTVTDLADGQTLTGSLAALDGEPIAAFHLGGHRQEDFRGADLVVVNPAVRPGDRFVQSAVDSGAQVTSEMELFLRACPAHVVGVTGSNGKSTTAAMIAAILRADGRRAWLVGNIGRSLLDELDRIGREEWVVLELSSFQLYHLGRDVPMPEVAVVTNCTPNHLNWHGTYPHYVAAKQKILRGQTERHLAVLNPADSEVSAWAGLVRGKLLPLVSPERLPPLRAPGEHNRVNAACAATVAIGVGCTQEAVDKALAEFGGLPGRLEIVAEVAGRRLYNDTTSTTPEATIAALEALEGPMWLLAGGADKGSDFTPLIAPIARQARGAAFFGAIGKNLAQRVAATGADLRCQSTETLDEAFRWCWEHSRPGDSIVLSPACSSHDQFLNFQHRGEAFLALVRALQGRQSE